MRLSLRWLARHVDLEGLAPKDVAEALTIHTAEVEGLEPFAPVLGRVVVGRVLERAKHPDADKLSVCKVDLGRAGDGGPRQIVCGAANVAAGQRVAVALPGTELAGGLKLKTSKIRGVESQGMICSERELGLGDEHAGIWVLPETLALGRPVDLELGGSDWVIEIDNKSLTHRPDLWGHRGVAGELAAIFARELRALPLELPRGAGGAPFPVRVESDGCPRYLALSIDGAANGRAPEWMRLLLLAAGQRPLDLLVDLSNFVMLDLGQPNHLFDRRKLSPEGILVRDARPGERMTTLDGVERVLTAEDMLVCSGDAPVAIAGVMGGAASKVEPDTSELLLEVASFHPTRVRRTAARLSLRTDASARFEKNLAPTLVPMAAAHLVNLLRELQPGIRLSRPAGDAGTWSDPATSVRFRPARARALLGADVGDEEMGRTLVALGFGVAPGAVAKADWQVHIPSVRATKDVRIEEDLIEEIGRLHGYDSIPARALVAALEPPPRDERRVLVRKLQDRLAFAAGFHEAMTYSFQTDAMLAKLSLAALPHVEIVNPIQEGSSKVRRDLLPSLIGLLESNRRQRDDVRLFEIGKGYLPDDANERGEPREKHLLALAWMTPRESAGARFDASAFSRLQSVLEDAVRACARVMPAWSQEDARDLPRFAHPGRWASARVDGARDPLVVLCGLEPAVQRELGLAGELDGEVALAEISIDTLLAAPTAPHVYEPLARFPGNKVDVALALSDEVSAARAIDAIRQAGKGLVGSIELFDLFRGGKLGAGRKSLAFHVLLQAEERTVSDQDVAKFLARLERLVAETLGGELRRA